MSSTCGCIFFLINKLLQYSDLGQTTYPNLAKTVFALFMVFVPILLLNMLIAMMGNTYAHVIEQSEKEWVKQVKYTAEYAEDFLVIREILQYQCILLNVDRLLQKF